MRNEIEQQQFIYNVLETQIEFGVHRYGDTLPTIREASSYFLVSADTVRLAYLRLKEEGYISLRTCVGATVEVSYSSEEIQRHIKNYFSCRRAPLQSFAYSMWAFASHTQWFALKNAAPETLSELELLCTQKEIAPVYRMSRLLQLLYSPLGNSLLLRLFWNMFLFFQAPFVSIPQNLEAVNNSVSPFLNMIQLAREEDWQALWEAGEAQTAQFCAALRSFIDEGVSPNTCCEQVDFTWSIYKKSSQVCYSLCMDILTGIYEGNYPVGGFLPSPQRIALEKRVSLHTIRRAIGILGKLGATRTVNGVGTMVLPPSDCSNNCGLSDRTIRKRLADFQQCTHILTFSCRACAKITIASMDAGSIQQLRERLEEVKRSGFYEPLLYDVYKTVSTQAPYPAVRMIYAELTHQLFWGLPLRGLHGERESAAAHYLPYLEPMIDCLGRADADGFSAKLEKLQIAELNCTAGFLSGLGIREAAPLVLPGGEN